MDQTISWISDTISPARHQQKSSQHVRACAAGNGAVCSTNRKIVPYHGANPNTRNGVCLRSPSPMMAPVKIESLNCQYSVHVKDTAKYTGNIHWHMWISCQTAWCEIRKRPALYQKHTYCYSLQACSHTFGLSGNTTRDNWGIKSQGANAAGITCELVPSCFATHVTGHENLIFVTKKCFFSPGHDLDDARMYGWNFDTKGMSCFILSIFIFNCFFL